MTQLSSECHLSTREAPSTGSEVRGTLRRTQPLPPKLPRDESAPDHNKGQQVPKERDEKRAFGDVPREADGRGGMLRFLPLCIISSPQMDFCYGRCKNLKKIYMSVVLKVYEKLLPKFLNSKLS